MRTDLAYAQALDAADPLAHFRSHFAHPDAGLVYVDGNSLGRLPHAALTLADDLLRQQWGDRLIRSWNEGWFHTPERIGAKIASLLGAQPDEVIVADSTSVNFFKLLVAGLRHAQARDERRTRILTDDLNFPSDLYIIQEAIDLLGKRHTAEIAALAGRHPRPHGRTAQQLWTTRRCSPSRTRSSRVATPTIWLRSRG